MAGSHLQPQRPVTESEPSHESSDHGYEGLKLASDGMLDPRPQGKYVSLTERNMAGSLLLRLPRELRAMIYGYVFTGVYVQNSESRLFTPESVAHPSFLSVCRSFYAEARFLPFTNARFIFGTWGILDMGSTVKGVPYMAIKDSSHDEFLKRVLEDLEQRAPGKRVFKYSAQSDKIATLQLRTSRVPCLVSSTFVKELEVLPGLRRIILRPVRIKRRTEMRYDLSSGFDEEKVRKVRDVLGGSVRVEYEEDDLLDYELLDWELEIRYHR